MLAKLLQLPPRCYVLVVPRFAQCSLIWGRDAQFCRSEGGLFSRVSSMPPMQTGGLSFACPHLPGGNTAACLSSSVSHPRGWQWAAVRPAPVHQHPLARRDVQSPTTSSCHVIVRRGTSQASWGLPMRCSRVACMRGATTQGEPSQPTGSHWFTA